MISLNYKQIYLFGLNLNRSQLRPAGQCSFSFPPYKANQCALQAICFSGLVPEGFRVNIGSLFPPKHENIWFRITEAVIGLLLNIYLFLLFKKSGPSPDSFISFIFNFILFSQLKNNLLMFDFQLCWEFSVTRWLDYSSIFGHLQHWK